MFKNRNQLIRLPPKQGDKIVVSAKVSLYEGRGDYQLICEHLEQDGSGALQQAFETLKLQLNQQGLFSTQHKRPIPKHPKHIGIITSSTGAAVHDILTVLKRRFPGLPVTLYPTAVQGEEAARQICRAIALAEAHQQCDVLIVGRGGGSLEDLWPFNEERVARAIFACEIPIVSAVGHEVDTVISDYVADVRAPTPSAAAELLSPDQHNLQIRLNQQQLRLHQLITQKVDYQSQLLQNLKSRLRHPGQTLREQSQRLDLLELRLRSAWQRKLEQKKNRLEQLDTRIQGKRPDKLLEKYNTTTHNLYQRLQKQIQVQLNQSRLHFQALASQLHTVSPLATLERGYAIVKDKQGNVIREATPDIIGQKIDAQLGQGSLRCTVDEVKTD